MGSGYSLRYPSTLHKVLISTYSILLSASACNCIAFFFNIINSLRLGLQFYYVVSTRASEDVHTYVPPALCLGNLVLRQSKWTTNLQSFFALAT